jgi:hypothetical protein
VDHSRISDAFITIATRLHSPRRTTSDWTRVPTLAALLAGVVIALVAAAVSGPIDPDSLAVMVAFP